MNLATPAHLREVTGETRPEAQYQVLLELGCNPIFRGGKVRIYKEVIAQAMLSDRKSKPKLNI